MKFSCGQKKVFNKRVLNNLELFYLVFTCPSFDLDNQVANEATKGLKVIPKITIVIFDVD
jgi:hypothetical protein